MLTVAGYHGVRRCSEYPKLKILIAAEIVFTDGISGLRCMVLRLILQLLEMEQRSIFSPQGITKRPSLCSVDPPKASVATSFTEINKKSRDSVAFCVLNDRDQREKSEDQDLALYKQGARFGNHSVHLCVTVRSTLLSLSPSEGNIWPHNMPNMLHYRTSTVRRKETDTRLRIIHTKIYKSLLNETTKHFLDEEVS
ncbi:hypothetical protein ACJJTC_015204 [Scirpophaga incertulas]